MMNPKITRRKTLKAFSGVASGGMAGCFTSVVRSEERRSPNERPRVGVVGNGGIARSHARGLKPLADIVAIADVDKQHLEQYNAEHAGGNATQYTDYRDLIDTKGIDAIFVCTPDHWHVKIAIDAMRAGKDVYCEKPATLTIDEGRTLGRVIKETGRVLQVGTQQRSSKKFQTAVALAHSQRLGKMKRVTVAIGSGPKGPAFDTSSPPSNLNWNMWQGQTPGVDYIAQRCHGNFRWWYEYSGGKMTDWGAHHVDIAQLAIAPDLHGPESIELVHAEHPVAFENGVPTVSNTYNTATSFKVRCVFSGGVEMFIVNDAKDLGFDNGIMFESDGGRYFVNRGKLTGSPIEDLAKNPLPEDLFTKLRKGQDKLSHRANFFACCDSRDTPISDAESHCRHLNTCHLSNIAVRLGRSLKWDATKQQVIGDEQANAFQKRVQRKGFEVV